MSPAGGGRRMRPGQPVRHRFSGIRPLFLIRESPATRAIRPAPPAPRST
jgi:hypothetical protein